MATEQGIRALLVEHLGVSEELIDQLQMIDIALALGEILGVAFPLYRLRHLMTYRDLLRAARDALNEQLAQRRRLLCAGPAAGGGRQRRPRRRPDADLCHRPCRRHPARAGRAPASTSPCPTTSAMRTSPPCANGWPGCSGATVPLIVRRAGDVGPDISVPWDRMTQERAQNGVGGPLVQRCGRGIAIAFDTEDQPFDRRRFPA